MNKWICDGCKEIIYNKSKPTGYGCKNPIWGRFFCVWIQSTIEEWEIKALENNWSPNK